MQQDGSVGEDEGEHGREEQDRPRSGAVLAARIAAVLLLVAGVVGVVVLVRRGGGGSSPAPTEPSPSAEASPFEVVDPPAGFTLVRAGTGVLGPIFVTDSGDPDEGYALLSPDGEVGPDLLAVGYVAFEDGVVPPVPPGPEPTYFGEPGVVGDSGWWSEGAAVRDLGLLRAPGFAVRVSSTSPRDRAELLSIARSVPLPPDVPTSDGDGWDRPPPPPPAVDDGFAGLRVVGRVSPVAASALRGSGGLDGPLGPTGARIQIWRDEAGTTLGVATIPGRAADLAALGRHPWLEPGVEELEDGPAGRPLLRTRCTEWSCEALVTATADGDLVVATLTGEPTPATRAALRHLVEVRTVDEARWDELADRAFGGPGLHPDPGAQELARGGEGADAWLLQTPPTGAYRSEQGSGRGAMGGGPSGTEESLSFDDLGIAPCLKFGDGTRECAGPPLLFGKRPGFEADLVRRTGPTGETRRGAGVTLLLAVGYPEAASVRLTPLAGDGAPTGDGAPADQVVPLRPTPAGDARFAVVDAEVAMAVCHLVSGGPQVPTGLVVTQIELLDGTGRSLGCPDGLIGG